MNSKYYDGTKLLSMMDINGQKPEIYICTSNRSAGKTTYFTRLAVNRFKKNKSKFAFLYRFNYELKDCADKIFKDVNQLFFQDDVLRNERRSDGEYHELLLNDIPCGYAISINAAENIKKLSHFLSDVELMIFDEFQSEVNKYCPDEITKFQSIHTSIARGRNKQVRYVPVIMISNPITLLNPYYIALGISDRLRSETHFLRGDGFVLEQGFNAAASKAQQESAFNRAFGTSKYVQYASQGVYLNDQLAFIETMTGRNRYLATLRYDSIDYGVREYPDSGIVYVDKNPDLSHRLKIAITKEDHSINYVHMKNNEFFLSNLRFFFDHGCFRFKDLQCKEALLKAIAY